MFLRALSGIDNEIFVTEFGGTLSKPNYRYEEPSPLPCHPCHVASFQGMDDAVTELRRSGRGVAGAFFYHGWDNGDVSDFWLPANQNGSAKVLKILQDAGGLGT